MKRLRPCNESLDPKIEMFCAHPLPKSPLLIHGDFRKAHEQNRHKKPAQSEPLAPLHPRTATEPKRGQPVIYSGLGGDSAVVIGFEARPILRHEKHYFKAMLGLHKRPWLKASSTIAKARFARPRNGFKIESIAKQKMTSDDHKAIYMCIYIYTHIISTLFLHSRHREKS